MTSTLKFTLGACALALATHAAAQITVYEGEGYRGRAFTTTTRVVDFRQMGFNDRASSMVVARGRWEVCEDIGYAGRCAVLRRGSYDSLRGMGLNDRVSSMRPVAQRARYDNEAPPPLPAPDYAYRRRPNERTYEVPVTAVRAVVGPPEQRCWVERQQVTEPRRSQPNVGGAILGGIIGGILGHQVGGGTGRDIATAGGAVAGVAIGANVGRGGSTTTERDVQRCETVASGPPEYWDVSYSYRGRVHHVQMSEAPGPTIIVNRDGEPRQ
jgi:uncharacterized protein YcfJ